MITKQKLTDRLQTVKEIERLANNYSSDIKLFNLLNLKDFFNYVKKIKYKMDKRPFEVLKRPKFIINSKEADCKKKTILLVAYAKNKNIPYRYITMSKRANGMIHHIYPQFYLNGSWVNIDATYDKPDYDIGIKKNVTNYKIYYAKDKNMNTNLLSYEGDQMGFVGTAAAAFLARRLAKRIGRGAAKRIAKRVLKRRLANMAKRRARAFFRRNQDSEK